MSYTKAIEPGALPPPAAVAWTPDLSISPVDPEVSSICEKAARWFSTLGAKVVDASPDVHDAQELFQVRMLEHGWLLLVCNKLWLSPIPGCACMVLRLQLVAQGQG